MNSKKEALLKNFLFCFIKNYSSILTQIYKAVVSICSLNFGYFDANKFIKLLFRFVH